MSAYQNPANYPTRAVPNNGHGSDRMLGLTLGAGTVCLGLIAGFFFDWATSIMPSLAEADDRTYVIVMQKTITNINSSPLFLLSLMGAFVFTGVAAILQHRLGAKAALRWTLAGLAFYVVAVMITMGVHFPLNDTLEKAGDPDTIDLAALRADTEDAWVAGHLARTGAAVLGLVFLCRALWLRRR
jgi:uncharacterized membrane protein